MESWEMKYQEALAWLETEPLLKNLTSDDPQPNIWYRRKLNGCVNAGESENWLYLKKGSSENLIIFFIGGGFAFTSEMASCPGSMRDFFRDIPQPVFYTDECHPNNEYYFFHVLGNRGIFSLEPGNRFADWSIAMINYGTADMHIGDGDYTYMDAKGKPVTLHHHGYRNFCAAMDVISRLFPNPEKLLITGESAGAFAVSALSPDVAERYPVCKNITICLDSACLQIHNWSEIVRNIWQAPEHIAKGIVSNNIVLDMARQTQARIGNRAKYLFLCGFPDGVLATFQNYVSTGELAPTGQATQNMRMILSKQIHGLKEMEIPFGIYLHQFTQNGLVQHCTLDAPTFRCGSPSPMDWLYNAINGENTDYGMELLLL